MNEHDQEILESEEGEQSIALRSEQQQIARSESKPFPVAPVVFAGASCLPVSTIAADILSRKCELEKLDVLPTGEIYLSQVHYRKRLNEAFSPAGWALVPLGKPSVFDNTVIQEWALYAQGNFIACSYGEAEYFPDSKRSSYATALESAKSNALMRCCKDLGVASECWDKKFTSEFKKEFCVQVWRKDSKDRKPQWRLKDGEPFYDETGFVTPKSQPQSSNGPQAGFVATPQQEDPSRGIKSDPIPPPSKAKKITAPELKRMFAIATKAGRDKDNVRAVIERFGFHSAKDVLASQYEKICEALAKPMDMNEATASNNEIREKAMESKRLLIVDMMKDNCFTEIEREQARERLPHWTMGRLTEVISRMEERIKEAAKQAAEELDSSQIPF